MATQTQTAFAKITLDLAPPVARLTLANPPVNVIDLPMMDELVAALEQIEQRPEISIIVLAGSERAFSVGVDVKAHTPDQVPEMLGKFHSVIRSLLATRKLTIAAVRGNCLGGGAGSTETHANQQLPPFDLGPAMTRWSGGTVMAADSFGALWFLWHFDSDYLNSNWYSSPVGNAVANAGYPAITRFSDGSSIASVAYDGSLWFYWNVDGTPAWGSSRVAAAGSAALSPAIARFRDGTDIAAAGRDGSLWFYWNVDGTPAWNSSEVEGQGSVYDSPAMTRSSSSTEIAVIVR